MQYLASSTVYQFVLIAQPERSPLLKTIDGIPLQTPARLEFAQQVEFGLKAGGLLKSGWDINGYLASHLGRVPQLRVVSSSEEFEFALNEPRVFTLGLTATQSIGDLVLRFEAAAHVNRALPEAGLQNAISSDQLVFNMTGDITFFDDLLVSGQVWAERWTATSSENFARGSELLGVRVRKPFISNRLELSAGAFGSFVSGENVLNAGANLRAFNSLHIAGELFFAETSKGHALARRNFKNLVRSSLTYQF